MTHKESVNKKLEPIRDALSSLLDDTCGSSEPSQSRKFDRAWDKIDASTEEKEGV